MADFVFQTLVPDFVFWTLVADFGFEHLWPILDFGH